MLHSIIKAKRDYELFSHSITRYTSSAFLEMSQHNSTSVFTSCFLHIIIMILWALRLILPPNSFLKRFTNFIPVNTKISIGLHFLLYIHMILSAFCLILMPSSSLTRFTNIKLHFNYITTSPHVFTPFTPPCFFLFTPVTNDDVSHN